jgi:S-adenosylmethionine-diacylglycerol 3-amino-3-carboxypropyl transferase
MMDSADLAVLRYARVWEDHVLLEEALDVTADDDVLSIGSAGDNVLALLALGPRSVTAVDVSPAQCALLHLQLAAVGRLDYDDFTVLLGHTPDDGRRLPLLAKLRPELPPTARAWWDDRVELVTAGIAASGRLERYIRQFFDQVVADLVDRDDWRVLLDTAEGEERAQLFDARVATAPFVERFDEYFGPETMGRVGRDPSQLRYVEVDVAGSFLDRFRRACCELPTASNPYLRRMLLDDEAPAPAAHLDPERYGRLAGLVERVEVVTTDMGGALAAAEPGRWSKANLSNIFEYLSPADSDRLFTVLGHRLRAGGRLAWWNLLVTRVPPAAERSLTLDPRSPAWSACDRSFLYGAFYAATCQGPDGPVPAAYSRN